MTLKIVLSTMIAATMLGATVSPAFAQGKSNGKGKKLGHYKNGKAYGNHPSQRKSGSRILIDDRRYRDSDDYRYRSSGDYRNSSNYELDRLSDRRQQTKNEWRNLAYLSGGLAVLGLLQKDNRLVFAGAAGALYSLHRYEQDRKSQSRIDRARAYYFSQPYFVRDGRRYDRRLVTRDGTRYYQFVRR
jgi:hypothetical protein